ncbi:UDP-N-acetylglucosamine--LPS N-acetylglucosamine transferase [Salinispora arenicola]|uniref:UDP-N-acetylglucosamine--LPS N-acetylglucosamine transferase n=1 Tax=Salinispora arenicola TaxID=168697 RepID=UPI00036F56E7|nr:UDP-N-acetylglucosamine--LPS N-acetylglucosamine transferase [Salinispora arenicola]
MPDGIRPVPLGAAVGAGRDDPGGDPGRMRILVVSADIGAGHDAAAAELAARLGGDEVVVEQLNFFTALPRPLHLLVREGYRTMLQRFPWSYDALFRFTDRSSLTLRAFRAALRAAAPRMLSRIPADTRLVVTTHPFANQLLGPMRGAGQLTVPVLSYVTDFVIHPVWISPGVDTYCVIHDATQQQAMARGARDVRVVDPLISAEFASLSTACRRTARARFGLPAQDRLALIVAGSWGVGDVTRTARDVLATGCVTPVVACGRNDDLRHRLRTFPGHIMGWVDDMPTLMRAVDVVVENAGGLTCQQSLACGLPTITYRPISGHGRANARVLADAGLTTYVTTAAQLQPVLSALTLAEGGLTTPAVTATDMAALISDVVRTDHR